MLFIIYKNNMDTYDFNLENIFNLCKNKNSTMILVYSTPIATCPYLFNSCTKHQWEKMLDSFKNVNYKKTTYNKHICIFGTLERIYIQNNNKYEYYKKTPIVVHPLCEYNVNFILCTYEIKKIDHDEFPVLYEYDIEYDAEVHMFAIDNFIIEFVKNISKNVYYLNIIVDLRMCTSNTTNNLNKIIDLINKTVF